MFTSFSYVYYLRFYHFVGICTRGMLHRGAAVTGAATTVAQPQPQGRSHATATRRKAQPQQGRSHHRAPQRASLVCSYAATFAPPSATRAPPCATTLQHLGASLHSHCAPAMQHTRSTARSSARQLSAAPVLPVHQDKTGENSGHFWGLSDQHRAANLAHYEAYTLQKGPAQWRSRLSRIPVQPRSPSSGRIPTSIRTLNLLQPSRDFVYISNSS